jgi:hypothetical protein
MERGDAVTELRDLCERLRDLERSCKEHALCTEETLLKIGVAWLAADCALDVLTGE